jgi:hypothetical protein
MEKPSYAHWFNAAKIIFYEKRWVSYTKVRVETSESVRG